jgi:murein DD-endopeptidase MepM/ murein hydrolase activator NlpD
LLNAASVRRVFAPSRSTRPETSTESTIGPSPATPRRLHRRAIGVARFCADTLTATPRARQRALAAVERRVRDAQVSDRAKLRRRLNRRRFMLRLTTDRALPIGVALIVLIAAGASLAPGAAPVGAAVGNTAFDQGGGERVRLSIGGNVPAPDAEAVVGLGFADAAVAIDDGTIYKPVAVDTSIHSSAGMLQHYTVKEGDTLTGIASRFGVSMMTVFWANKLDTTQDLKVGRDLIIPPVNGLIVTVKAGDTLDSLAKDNKITVAEIIQVNDLQDTNLIVGQVLVLPGAKGAPLPTPKPTTAPVTPFGAGCGSCGGNVKFQGGAWAWPVVGGGNYISQYFTAGHLGVDIAAAYGTTIVSPLAGQVIWAGWKSNGGGYQVWISHGNGIYTSLNHMSAVTSNAGQHVDRGQRVGRVGNSGWATGSHLHLEVWIGVPWESGSYRVNPLRYY